MNKTSREILKSVLSLPTMSFHETAVATFIRWYLAGLGFKVREDRAGNILVSYRGTKAKSGVTFAAHMDHPGFEVISAKGRTATVALWGKVDPKTFSGARVIVYTKEGAVKGRIGKRVLKKKHLKRFCFALSADGKIAKGGFGHYDLPAVRFRNGRIRTRAADNLVSVSAILDLLTGLAGSRAKVNVAGLFTRGEESGFLGAFAAMESGLIPKKDPLVVLECSSAKGGGVKIGGGPVIRAGDHQSTFDPAVDVWLSSVASNVKSRNKSFHYQRALLSGGRCEACVYVAEGFRTGGIAMPLGNYHNQGERGYAPEFVSVDDYDWYVDFMNAIAQSPMPRNCLHTKAAPIWKNYRRLKGKLFSSGKN